MYTRLNDDTKLFTIGMGGKKIFDVPDADLMLIDGFFGKEESDHYYNIFRHDLRRSSKGI